MSDSLLTTTAAEARPTADGPAASDPTGDAQSDVADISPELWWDRLQEIGQVSEGAALLAGMGAGVWRSAEDLPTLPEGGDLFEPTSSQDQRDAGYDRWQAAVKLVQMWHS